MLFVNRRARKSNERGASHGSFQPRCEGLEAKILLTIDLGLFNPPNNPNIASRTFWIRIWRGYDPQPRPPLHSAPVPAWRTWATSTATDMKTSPSPPPARVRLEQLRQRRSSARIPCRPAPCSNWIGNNGATPPSFQLHGQRPRRRLEPARASRPPPRPTRSRTPTSTSHFPASHSSALNNLVAGLSSVAGVNIGGRQGLLIGAPGSTDANSANPGTGRVYLISGNFNSYAGQTVNLDNPANYPNLTIVTFVSTATLGGLGTSVAGGVNIFGDGSADIIMGAAGRHRRRPDQQPVRSM